MWMIDPKLMCRQHLLGEHNEIHKHRHNFVKGHKIDGRITGNAVEPLSMEKRHDELVDEMLTRGYNHHSPYEQPDISHYPPEQQNIKVNIVDSKIMLMNRCDECRQLIEAREGF
jgi:hypothetical protein